jgi:hypothetical protein
MCVLPLHNTQITLEYDRYLPVSNGHPASYLASPTQRGFPSVSWTLGHQWRWWYCTRLRLSLCRSDPAPLGTFGVLPDWLLQPHTGILILEFSACANNNQPCILQTLESIYWTQNQSIWIPSTTCLAVSVFNSWSWGDCHNFTYSSDSTHKLLYRLHD